MAPSRRVAIFLGLVGAACALAVVPGIAAASSVTGEIIRGLNRRLLYIAVPIAVLVEVILVYAVVRFRGADDPTPTRENRQLEITWTVATGLVLLFVGTASFTALTSPYVGDVPTAESGSGQTADIAGANAGHGHGVGRAVPGSAPPGAVEIVAVGEQWSWRFEYPQANATSDELVLPRDRDVYLYVTSDDVLHAVHVPKLGLKQDAFPGQYSLLRTRATQNGTYRLYCGEFCGTHHADMEAPVHVVDHERFAEWLDGNATGPVPGGGR